MELVACLEKVPICGVAIECFPVDFAVQKIVGHAGLHLRQIDGLRDDFGGLGGVGGGERGLLDGNLRESIR